MPHPNFKAEREALILIRDHWPVVMRDDLLNLAVAANEETIPISVLRSLKGKLMVSLDDGVWSLTRYGENAVKGY